MEARLHRADGNLEQRRQFFQRQIVEEEEGEDLTLVDRQLVEGMAKLLGVFKGGDVVVAAVVGQLFGIAFNFGRLDAKAADRGVTARSCKGRREACADRGVCGASGGA